MSIGEPEALEEYPAKQVILADDEFLDAGEQNGWHN
jgi:hypothetical protein